MLATDWCKSHKTFAMLPFQSKAGSIYLLEFEFPVKTTR